MVQARKGCQLCIYNKAAERRPKGDIGAFNFKSWIRYDLNSPQFISTVYFSERIFRTLV